MAPFLRQIRDGGHAMTESGPSAGLPLALVAGEEEGSAGWIEDALGSNGFAVLRTPTGQHASARARTTNPDVILMEAVLPDMSGLELCRSLREDPRISKSTPLLVTTPHTPTREQRIEALRAGAWECIGRETDGTELVLKLRALMRAKLDAAAATILRSVQALKSAGRLSDIVGRLGPTDFAVIAPANDPQGAVHLAD